MVEEANGEVRFECLKCGKVSRIERVEGIQPRCSSCGAGTGVVGDIGQGTFQDRLRRMSAERAEAGGDVSFECLRCGTVTRVPRVEVIRPGCAHCGSGDGVVLDG